MLTAALTAQTGCEALLLDIAPAWRKVASMGERERAAGLAVQRRQFTHREFQVLWPRAEMARDKLRSSRRQVLSARWPPKIYFWCDSAAAIRGTHPQKRLILLALEARQGHLLRAAAAAVADGDIAAVVPNPCWLEGHGDRAGPSRRNTGAAGVRLGKSSRTCDRDAANAERRAPRLAQRRRQCFGAGSYHGEAQAGRIEFHHRACARQTHRLRAARSVIGNRQRPRSGSPLRGFEGRVDGAARFRRQARTASVRLAEVPARGDTGDTERHLAIVGQRNRLRDRKSVV